MQICTDLVSFKEWDASAWKRKCTGICHLRLTENKEVISGSIDTVEEIEGGVVINGHYKAQLERFPPKTTYKALALPEVELIYFQPKPGWYHSKFLPLEKIYLIHRKQASAFTVGIHSESHRVLGYSIQRHRHFNTNGSDIDFNSPVKKAIHDGIYSIYNQWISKYENHIKYLDTQIGTYTDGKICLFSDRYLPFMKGIECDIYHL